MIRQNYFQSLSKFLDTWIKSFFPYTNTHHIFFCIDFSQYHLHTCTLRLVRPIIISNIPQNNRRLAVFLIEPISSATVLFERLTRIEYYRGRIVGSIFIRSICNSSLLPFGLSGLRLAHLRVVFHPDNRH